MEARKADVARANDAIAAYQAEVEAHHTHAQQYDVAVNEARRALMAHKKAGAQVLGKQEALDQEVKRKQVDLAGVQRELRQLEKSAARCVPRCCCGRVELHRQPR